MDERKLTAKLRQGDRLALNRAMDVFTPHLSSVVWHVMGPSATAEDVEEVVSDTFLALWYHRSTLDPAQGLKPWLSRIARNKAIDRLRAAPPPPLPLEEAEALAISTQEESMTQRLFAQQLWEAVASLEPPDDQLVLRFYYDECKLKDIAVELGLSTAAAKTRLHRARQKLKEILTKGGAANETYR